MRIWNLVSLESLQPTVVLSYKTPPASRKIDRSSQSSKLRSSFKVAVVTAAVAAAFVVEYPKLSSTAISVVPSESVVAQSVPRISLPLASKFEGRFGVGWTEADESDALGKIAAAFDHRPPVYDEEEAIDVAFANQREGLDRPGPLSREDVANIIRKKRFA